MHCMSAGLGSHCPPVSVSVQVLVVGPEGMSPSSHWKVAIVPSVVPDTVVLVEIGGNSGAPQSTGCKLKHAVIMTKKVMLKPHFLLFHRYFTMSK